MLILFMYQRELFIDLDTIKLLFLSVSISFSLIVACILPSTCALGHGKTQVSLIDSAFSGALLALGVVTMSIVISYFISADFSYFMKILIGCYVLTGIGINIDIIFSKKAKT